MSGPGDRFNFKVDLGALKHQMSMVLKDYKGWIGRHPGRATDVESFFKILAYLLPGRIRGTSTVLPELLYSTSNVLSFWHDHILRCELELAAHQARLATLPREERNGNVNNGPSSSTSEDSEAVTESGRDASKKKMIFRIQVVLTILEYFEVFLEVAAKRLWGDFGRWVIIFVMQAVKTALRAVLLFYYKVGLIRTPAIPTFDRSKYHPNKITQEQDMVIVLKHSGRVIRKLHASPPIYSRDWDVPEVPRPLGTETNFTTPKLMAEVIHIARPLCHLVSLGACGTSSWKPWLLSLAMDVGSLYLHGDPLHMPKQDQAEIQKRTITLLMYLLRSPFYDRATKRHLLASLAAVGKRLPLVGNLLLLLAQAIPQWQSTYSYVWSDF